MKIIDGIMGIGKTNYILEKINNSSYEEKYIYITPYLEEIKRVKNTCSKKNFISPDENKMGTKTRHLKYLVNKGYNICATHSLFKGADEELLELLLSKNYTLVLDEVLDIVEPIQASKKDLKEILDRYAHIDKDTQQLIWDDLDYKGNHIEVKRMAMAGSLIVIDNVILLWKFPIEIFTSFKEVYLLTYLFDSQIQKYYFDYYNVKYEKYTFNKNKQLIEYGENVYEKELKKKVKEKLYIYKGNLNLIGEHNYSLSKSWFDKNKNNLLLENLKNNIYNYFKHITRTKSKYNGWTTFKDYRKDIKGKGYTKGFIPLNMRASNDYIHKTSMAYISNRFINPFIKKMFQHKNIIVDEDQWALSEMIQWIWRGSIRDGENMNLYIPSKRMRELLENWLEGQIDD